MVDQNSQFYAILTKVGAAKQANADALGIPWKITHMAVGDASPGGQDNPPLPMPDASWTSLLNEWRRAPLNQLKVDDKDPAIIVAEQVIPADIGGRWIREVGLYDADGDLVAVANCAPTYKPLLNQGSGRTQVVRMNLVVSSASNVQLKIDPSVVLATREFVTEELAKRDFKHSVLAATTAAITLSGLQTVDGVALQAGARVLVKNQAAGKDNGLYLVVAGGGWTRCTDADTDAKVTPGLLMLVERGTVNGDSAWQLVTDSPVTVGVTALVFEMAFGRSGVAAGIYRSVTVDTYGRVVAATNPTTVAGYGLTDVYTKIQLDQALALKAPLVSPAFTSIPTAPTAATGTNTAQLANTAFVQAAISALVASSPAALDTLNELAAALGNDPNFATTVTNSLALKAPLAGPTFTGDPKAPTPATTDNDASIATTAFVRAAMSLFGIGSTGNNFGGNIDTLSLTGFYLVSNNAGTLPSWPKGYPGGATGPIVGGSLIHIERSTGGAATQLWDSLVNTDYPLSFIRTRKLGGAWLPWREILTSGNTPKQSDFLDDTPGAIMTPGSFGWGGKAVNYTGSVDAIAATGLYLISASTTGTKPAYPHQQGMGEIVNGTVLHLERGSSQMATQIWDSLYNIINPITCVRTKSASGVWSPWQALVFEGQLPFRGTVVFKDAGLFTWTVPVGAKKVWVKVIGGGGGGGVRRVSGEAGGGGGGGGGVAEGLFDIGGLSTIPITVGEGGLGATTPAAGGNGKASAFGSFCSATGGTGGQVPSPGISGIGTGGTINTGLGDGSYGTLMTAAVSIGGLGGGPGSSGTTAGSAAGRGPGGGGGGSGNSANSFAGNGAPGMVIIQW